jgi:hypothetical protein
MIPRQVLNSPKTPPRLQQLRKQLDAPPKPQTDRLKKVRKKLVKDAPSVSKANSNSNVAKFVAEIALGWKDKLTFGKYSGKTLKFIFNQDPMYLAYIQSVNTTIVYSNDIMTKLAPFLVEEDFDDMADFDVPDPNE